MTSQSSPIRPCFKGSVSPVLEKSIQITEKRRQNKKYIIWGSVNAVVLSIILYDLHNQCPLHDPLIRYCEYILALIVTCNLINYLYKFCCNYVTYEKVTITSTQKKLLGIKDFDSSFNVVDTPVSTKNVAMSPTKTPTTPATPMNTTALSWMSPRDGTPMNTSALSWLSPPESPNLSVSSSSWLFNRGSPNQRSPFNESGPKQFARDTSGIDSINDENSLHTYLNDYEKNEKELSVNPQSQQSMSWSNTFWNYPLSKVQNDVSPFLVRNQYQLSQQSPVPNPSPKSDDKGSPINQSAKGMETWKKLSVNAYLLTQWNENLRLWISQTIISRLVKEIINIDAAFQSHGLNDIIIGQVGLDRLRKTAQMGPVAQFIPTLSALIPFLELTPNQEYLVKRIKELSKGGCMSEFKWNGGGSFNGKDWDHNLPTDSSIIMHLFASYMDTQLMPAPNKPDAKPFSTFHFIKAANKNTDVKQFSLAIQETTIDPPHYRVVIGDEVYELVKGYNNLFHSILLFLYHVNQKEHGMLGRVNLGKSGLNMLWIINS